VIDEVIVGDIESMPLSFREASSDVLIASEVLERLVDPGAMMRKLHPLLKPGGIAFASTPTIAHRSTLAMLIAGRWDLDPEGRMDRTHLRWFTPKTFAELFQQNGYDVVSIAPARRPGLAARMVNSFTRSRFEHLFISEMVVEARVVDRVGSRGLDATTAELQHSAVRHERCRSSLRAIANNRWSARGADDVTWPRPRQ
jgi:SAM-dependent methyltransferase